MNNKNSRSLITELSYYVKYKDNYTGLTWEYGALYPQAFQVLGEFTRDGLKEDEEAGRIEILDVKNFIIKESK